MLRSLLLLNSSGKLNVLGKAAVMATQLSTPAFGATTQTPVALEPSNPTPLMSIKSICENSFEASVEGRANFPKTVEHLSSVGIVRYTIDLKNKQKSYVTSSGDVIHSDIHLDLQEANTHFDALKIVNAIQRVQRSELNYVQFLDEILNAGCASYTADFIGKFVEYKGIDESQSHVEHFPRPK
jgi:uncharacterized protein YbcV (DUF1398 family)